MNKSGPLKQVLLTIGALATFIGIACGVAFYSEATTPLWLKDFEKAQAIEDVDKKGAISLLRKALIEAEKENVPLSSKKRIEQKLSGLLFADFAQSDLGKTTQEDTLPATPTDSTHQ